MRVIRGNRLFQSTLSVRRATKKTLQEGTAQEFQSTLSVRRATVPSLRLLNPVVISIHALRKESDLNMADKALYVVGQFQSTLSVRRATEIRKILGDYDRFQSTLSVRRATELSASGRMIL